MYYQQTYSPAHRATDSDVASGQTPQKPTVQEPPLRAPTQLEHKKPPTFQWRLVDAQSFIYKGVIRLVRMDDFRDVDVIPISYTWSTDIEKWRDDIVQMGSGRTYEDMILRGSACVSRVLADGVFCTNDVDQASITRAHLFFTAVAFLVFTRDKKFFWIDILCVNQEEMEEKKIFVPRMGTIYHDSYETHAYPSGTEIAPSVMHNSVQKPAWETRAWTVQKQILAKRVMFCYLFRGDVADEVQRVGGYAFPDDETEVERWLNSPVLDRFRYSNGIYLLRRGDHVMTCHMEVETQLGNFAWKVITEQMNSSNGGVDLWTKVPEATSRTVMYRTIIDIRKSGSPLARARLCLEILPMRKSRRPEDMIYSALGTFNMEYFVPEYEIGFEEARLRVFESMEPALLTHLLGTDWESNQDGVHKVAALPRIVGGVPILEAAHLYSSILDRKCDRAIGTKLRCRAEKWWTWRPTMDIIRMTALTRSILRNDRLVILQGTPGYDQRSLALPAPSAVSTAGGQPECVRNIVIDGRLIGISDEEYFGGTQYFEKLIEFVEVGSCHASCPLVPPVGNTPKFRVPINYCRKIWVRYL